MKSYARVVLCYTDPTTGTSSLFNEIFENLDMAKEIHAEYTEGITEGHGKIELRRAVILVDDEEY